MSRRTGTVDAAYFDALYAADADPWRFATSAYEREKYAASLDALPHGTYGSALEIGCSIGILTAQLARRCRAVLALDVAEAALRQARINCPAPHVRFECRQVPAHWPAGRFDLIVLSEVLYYLGPGDLTQTARHATAALTPGGTILLVHYLGETDYPLSGDDAAELFIRSSGLAVLAASATEAFRIDVLAS